MGKKELGCERCSSAVAAGLPVLRHVVEEEDGSSYAALRSSFYAVLFSAWFGSCANVVL